MMSNEEWERKMDFLLNQQAQFDVDMRRLEAAQARTDETVERAAKNISHLAGFTNEGFGLIMNLFKETDTKFKETFKETHNEINALKESQKLTEELLQKFIAKVDRLTGEGQNGLAT